MSSRILSLPSRRWESYGSELIRQTTEQLKRPLGNQELRLIQAVGVLELSQLGGLYMQARVGAGKTLVAGLAPAVLGARNPLLMVPANGGGLTKTRRELEAYAQHWQIPIERITIRTYQWLGRQEQAGYLMQAGHDLVVCDEAHWLKNVRRSQGQVAAVAVRFADYFEAAERSGYRVSKVFLTGSPTGDGDALDFMHLVAWALGQRAPVPLPPTEQEAWAATLDGDGQTPVLGTLDADEAERRFRERLISTPGVIVSSDQFDGPLSIRPRVLELPDSLHPHYAKLRDLHSAPDDFVLGDALQAYRVARQFARGYYKRHDPRPPEPFIVARRAWAHVVRWMIESGLADSEGHAVNRLPSSGPLREIYERWAKWRADFPLNTVFELLDPSVAAWCARWALESPGLVWVHGREFGQLVAKMAGIPYYGLNAKGAIMAETGARSTVVSIKAIGQAYNLQGPVSKGRPHFTRNLITHLPSSGLDFEQLTGRTHRDEQERPVTVEWLLSCYEDLAAWWSLQNSAERIERRTSQPQKLNHATELELPIGAVNYSHAAWRQTAVRIDDDLTDD